MARAAWIEEYWDRGFVRLKGVFPADEIARLSAYFDEVLAEATGLNAITKRGLTEFRVVPIALKVSPRVGFTTTEC